MNVLFDHQIFSWQKYGGISRYFYELMKNFSDDINVMNSTVFSDNHYIAKNEIVKHTSILASRELVWKKQLYLKTNKLNSILSLKTSNYDLFHPTYYDPYFLKYLGKTPYVLTVHDMINEKFPNLFDKYDKTISYKRTVILNANKIIAVSENTKNDILEFIDLKPSMIEVIPHGFELLGNNSIVEKLDFLPLRYVLFVGERGHYKNFLNFSKALSVLMKEDKELYLVCTGKSFNEDEITSLTKLKIFDRVRQYQVVDNELKCLYSKSLAFVFPSYYEGFGIPILEAFSNNCPVILSDASSFPEVAGDAGFYFDPFDIDSIIHAIKTVIYDNEIRNKLIEKGNTRFKLFSWETTAKKTESIYLNL